MTIFYTTDRGSECIYEARSVDDVSRFIDCHKKYKYVITCVYGFDTVEILDAILRNTNFISKELAEEILNAVKNTERELYDIIDRYNDLANEV